MGGTKKRAVALPSGVTYARSDGWVRRYEMEGGEVSSCVFPPEVAARLLLEDTGLFTDEEIDGVLVEQNPKKLNLGEVTEPENAVKVELLKTDIYKAMDALIAHVKDVSDVVKS